MGEGGLRRKDTRSRITTAPVEAALHPWAGEEVLYSDLALQMECDDPTPLAGEAGKVWDLLRLAEGDMALLRVRGEDPVRSTGLLFLTPMETVALL